MVGPKKREKIIVIYEYKVWQRQKLGMLLRSVSKIEVFKKCAPKLLSLIEKKIHKNLENLVSLWK